MAPGSKAIGKADIINRAATHHLDEALDATGYRQMETEPAAGDIDFVKTGECGFEGGSLSFQQLDNESDYSCRTRKSMAYLGNSSAN